MEIGSSLKQEFKKTKSITLLTNKKEVRPSAKATAKLEKLNHQSLSQTRATEGLKGMDFTTKNDFPTFKSGKLTKEEQEFTIDYRKLEELEREKGIKFF